MSSDCIAGVPDGMADCTTMSLERDMTLMRWRRRSVRGHEYGDHQTWVRELSALNGRLVECQRCW